jgi:hypothetical protein
LLHCGWTLEQVEAERRVYGAGAVGDATYDRFIVETLGEIAKR